MEYFNNAVKATFNLTNVKTAVELIESSVKETAYRASEKEQVIMKLVGVCGILQSSKFYVTDKSKVADYLRKIADDLDYQGVVQ